MVESDVRFPTSGRPVLSGVVTEFSETRGLGTVTGDDGVRYLFHVIEIADDTRHIDVGQRVCFTRLPKFGMFQAGRLQKV